MDQNTPLIFKALADDTRIQMLLFLARTSELCVCDFETLLNIRQSKASRHLRYLLHAGLVQDRREVVWVYYRIAQPMGGDQALVLDAVNKMVSRVQERNLVSRLTKLQRQKDCTPAVGNPSRRRSSLKNRKRV